MASADHDGRLGGAADERDRSAEGAGRGREAVREVRGRRAEGLGRGAALDAGAGRHRLAARCRRRRATARPEARGDDPEAAAGTSRRRFRQGLRQGPARGPPRAPADPGAVHPGTLAEPRGHERRKARRRPYPRAHPGARGSPGLTPREWSATMAVFRARALSWRETENSHGTGHEAAGRRRPAGKEKEGREAARELEEEP